MTDLKIHLRAGDTIRYAAPYPRHVRYDEWLQNPRPVFVPAGYVVNDQPIPDAPRSYRIDPPFTMQHDGLVSITFNDDDGTAIVREEGNYLRGSLSDLPSYGHLRVDGDNITITHSDVPEIHPPS